MSHQDRLSKSVSQSSNHKFSNLGAKDKHAPYQTRSGQELVCEHNNGGVSQRTSCLCCVVSWNLQNTWREEALSSFFHRLKTDSYKELHIPPPSGAKWNIHTGDREERGEGRQRRQCADLRHFATRLFTEITWPLQQFSTRWRK